MLTLIHGLPTCGKSKVIELEANRTDSHFSFVYDTDFFDDCIPGLNALRDSDLNGLFLNKQVANEFDSYALRKSREKNKATMLSSLISLNGQVLALTNGYFKNLHYDFSFIIEPDLLLKRWQDRKTLLKLDPELANQWFQDSIAWAARNGVIQVILKEDQYLSDCLKFINVNGTEKVLLIEPQFTNIPSNVAYINMIISGNRIVNADYARKHLMNKSHSNNKEGVQNGTS